MSHETKPPTGGSEAAPESSGKGSRGGGLHPRPNLRRIGRLGAALTMILFLAGLTVLTFRYSRDTVTRTSQEAIPTATRPLGPDQIARLRNPEPPEPPGPPDLRFPDVAGDFPVTQPAPANWRPPARSVRQPHAFTARRPPGRSRSAPSVAESRRSAQVPTSGLTSAMADSGSRMEEALNQALSRVPGIAPGPGTPGNPEAPAEIRGFAAPATRAVRVGYAQPLTHFELKEGSYLPALLSHDLASELSGPVRAQVSRDVYDTVTRRHLLIPRGTTLLGRQTRQPVAGERRISIVWDRLVLPDGRSVDLTAGEDSALPALPSASADGTLGLRGRVNRHWPRRLGTAALLSLVGAGVQLSQPQRSAVGLNAADPGQLAAGELGLNLGRVSDRLLERTLDQPPTIELAAGTRVFVWVTRDLAFPSPYSR